MLEESQDMTEEYFETHSWNSDNSSDCNGEYFSVSSLKHSSGLRKQNSEGQHADVDGPQMNTDREGVMGPLDNECSATRLDSVSDDAGLPSLSHTGVFNTLEDSNLQLSPSSKDFMVEVKDSFNVVSLEDSGSDEAANQSPVEEAEFFSIPQSNTALNVAVVSREMDFSSSQCCKSLDSAYSERKTITGKGQLEAQLAEELIVTVLDDSSHGLSLKIISKEAGPSSISQALYEETLLHGSDAATRLERTPDLSTDPRKSPSPKCSPNLRNRDKGCDEVLNGSSLKEAGLPFISQASLSLPDLMESQLYSVPERNLALIYKSTSAPELNSYPDPTVASTFRNHGIVASSERSPILRNLGSSHSEGKNNGLEKNMDEKKHMIPLRLSPEEAGLPSFCQARMSDRNSVNSQHFRAFTHTLTLTDQNEAEPQLEIASDLDHMNFSSPKHFIDLKNLDSSHSEGKNNGLEMIIAGEELQGDSSAIISNNSECEKVLTGSSLEKTEFSFVSVAGVSSENVTDLLLTASEETHTLSDRRDGERQLDRAPYLDVTSVSSPKHSLVPGSIKPSTSEENIDGLEMNNDREQLMEPLARECRVIILDDNHFDGSTIEIFSKEAGPPSISQPGVSVQVFIDSQYSLTSKETSETSFFACKDQMGNCLPTCSLKCPLDLINLESLESSCSEIKNDDQQINCDGSKHKVLSKNNSGELSAVILYHSGGDKAADRSSSEEAGRPFILHSNGASKDVTGLELFTTEDTLASTDQCHTVLQLERTSESAVPSRDFVKCSSSDQINPDLSHVKIRNNNVQLKTDTELAASLTDNYTEVISDHLSCKEFLNPSSLEISSKKAGLPFISQASESDAGLIPDQNEATAQLDNSSDLGATCKDELHFPFLGRSPDFSHSEGKIHDLKININGEKFMVPLTYDGIVVTSHELENAEIVSSLSPGEAGLPSNSQVSVSDSDSVNSHSFRTFTHKLTLTDQSEAEPRSENTYDVEVSSPNHFTDLRNLDSSYLEDKNNGLEINRDEEQLMEPLTGEGNVIILDDNAAEFSSIKISKISKDNKSDPDSQLTMEREELVVPLTGVSNEILDNLRCDEVLNGSSLEEAGLSFSKATSHTDNTSNVDVLSTDCGNSPFFISAAKFRNLDSCNSERKRADEEDLIETLEKNINGIDKCRVQNEAIIKNHLYPEEAELPLQNDGLESNKGAEELMVPLDSPAMTLDDLEQDEVLHGPSPELVGLLSISQASMSNTDLISSQLFAGSKQENLAPADGCEAETYLENASDRNEEQLDNLGKPISEMALMSDIRVNTSMVEFSEHIDEARVKPSEVSANMYLDPSVDVEMFVDPLLEECICVQSYDSSRLQPEGVTLCLKDQRQFLHPNINKKNLFVSSPANTDCKEDGSLSLSHANSFISEPNIPINDKQTLDLDNDQTQIRPNDLEHLENVQFVNTCSMKEFTVIPQKEQQVVYSDNSGYIDSQEMLSTAGKEPQRITFNDVQDSYVGHHSGSGEGFFKESSPLNSVSIRFTKQVQQGDQATGKVCAKEHEVSISYDDKCKHEKSGFKTSLHFDAHHGSDTNNNTKQHTPEAHYILWSSTPDQELWSPTHPPLQDGLLNSFLYSSNRSASVNNIPELAIEDDKRNISNPPDVEDASQENIYEEECQLESNKEIVADPSLCPFTDVPSTCQSADFSQYIFLNGSQYQKLLDEQSLIPYSPFCPDSLQSQSYPFTEANTGIQSDLEPIMKSEHLQESLGSLDREQKDLKSSDNESRCNSLQIDKNDVLCSVRNLKGVSYKPENVGTTTYLTNRSDGNENHPNSSSPDQDFINANSAEVEDPRHYPIESNSSFTGGIQSILKDKEMKSMSTGKSSRFSRFTRIPSFRKSKKEPKVGNKVEPEAKISPEIGEERNQLPNYNPVTDDLTKYEDQCSEDIFGKSLGVTCDGQSKSISSSKNTKEINTYSEQIQIKSEPQKKSKSSDNFRMKLALAQRSLSHFFGEKDNQQDSNLQNQDMKSKQPWKKMKMSKEAEMLKRTYSLPGPSGARSKYRLQSDFVSGLTEDNPDLQDFQSSKEDLKIASHPDASASDPEMEPAQRNTMSNSSVKNSGIFKTVQSYENISETFMHPARTPSWTRSLSSFEGLDTPARPVTPKPQNPGVWGHRSSFRYPSKTVASSLSSLGEGSSLEGVLDLSQRQIGQRAVRLASAQSYDSEYLLKGSKLDNQSQTSLVSDSTNESEVSLNDFNVYIAVYIEISVVIRRHYCYHPEADLFFLKATSVSSVLCNSNPYTLCP